MPAELPKTDSGLKQQFISAPYSADKQCINGSLAVLSGQVVKKRV